MGDPYALLDGFDDEFLWWFLQTLDLPQLVEARGNNPRFATMTDRVEFIRDYNLRLRDVWTYTHFQSPRLPRNHRIIAFRAGNARMVSYNLRDFGINLDNDLARLQLVGGCRSVLVFWYQGKGFLVCNMWNMTHRLITFRQFWHVLEYPGVLFRTHVYEDNDGGFYYLLRYVFEDVGHPTFPMNVFVFSSEFGDNSVLNAVIEHSDQSNELTLEQINSVFCVREAIAPPMSVMFMSHHGYQFNHMFATYALSYFRVNRHLGPLFPHEAGYTSHRVIHQSHTGYILVEDCFVRDNGQPGHRFLRLNLFEMPPRSYMYRHVSSVPYYLIPGETVILVGPCLLRAYDHFVEFTVQISPPENDQNRWTCLILRFDIDTLRWMGFWELMWMGERFLAGSTISFRSGIIPQV